MIRPSISVSEGKITFNEKSAEIFEGAKSQSPKLSRRIKSNSRHRRLTFVFTYEISHGIGKRNIDKHIEEAKFVQRCFGIDTKRASSTVLLKYYRFPKLRNTSESLCCNIIYQRVNLPPAPSTPVKA